MEHENYILLILFSQLFHSMFVCMIALLWISKKISFILGSMKIFLLRRQENDNQRPPLELLA